MCACSTEDSVYDPKTNLDSDIDLDYDPDYNPDAEVDSDWKEKRLDHSNNITPDPYTGNSSIVSKCESSKNTLQCTYDMYHNVQQRRSASQDVEDNGLRLTNNQYSLPNDTVTHNNPKAAANYAWKDEHLIHSINITSDPQTDNSIIVPKCESNKVAAQCTSNISLNLHRRSASQDVEDTGQTKIPCNTLSSNLAHTHNTCYRPHNNKKITYKRTYNEKGYKCSVCHQKYKTEPLLSNHYMSLHRKNPFDSEQYPKYF